MKDVNGKHGTNNFIVGQFELCYVLIITLQCL